METETAKTTTTTTAAVATATEPVSVPEVTKQMIVEEEEEVKSTITTTNTNTNNKKKKEGDDGDKEEEVKGDPPKERLEAIGKKYIGATDGSAVVQWDPYLEPYVDVLRGRYRWYKELLQRIDASEGGLENFAHSYKRYGLNRGVDPATGIPGTFYREWAPHALNISLIGDFNGWDKWKNRCTRKEFGVWECFVPDRPDGRYGIPHKSLLRVVVETAPGRWEDRLPAWITRVVQFPGKSVEDGQFWCPGAGERHEWQHEACGGPSSGEGLRIYECHVGMATEEGRIGTYKEFAANVVPYVAAAGYNAVQLMAVMEHAYYASFGYQVTNFFAVAHRFGTPEELKELVDACHAHGLAVLLDVVHSHASKNVADGLNMFDGSDTYLFHAPPRGEHKIWNSRLFDYGNWETLRFLLSNLAWYLEEYRFDGFRFDGVTSILYTHHGIGKQTFDYPHYFRSGAVDGDALAYLTLANELIHRIRPRAVSIAEDVSGFPCLCRPTAEGGVGFDYRLNMAGPDLWVHLLKEVRDEDWHVGDIAWTLTNRRWMERCIGYAESHDQALVGDKTIAFWLMDKEMYTHMTVLGPLTPVVDRGIALHKLIRLLTFALAGEGYLNFMGNEFGHPEWIDFPREGNGNSYHYARRQWGLVRDPLLRYRLLAAFDKALMALDHKYDLLPAPQAYFQVRNEGDKLLAFERAGLLFVVNLHPSKSFSDYPIPVSAPGEYHIVLDSDRPDFCGLSRVDPASTFFSQPKPYMGMQQFIKVYSPCRSALVLRRKDLDAQEQ